MEEIKKELAELKELVSILLDIKTKEFNLKYGSFMGKEERTSNHLF